MSTIQKIKDKITDLEGLIRVYERMQDNDELGCDMYEEYDLNRGQLEAYEEVLKMLVIEKKESSFRKFFNLWLFSNETAIKAGFMLGCLFETGVFILSIIICAVIGV